MPQPTDGQTCQVSYAAIQGCGTSAKDYVDPTILPSDTAYTNLMSGRPARGIVNRVMRELGPLSPLPPAFPLAAAAIAPLRAEAERRGYSDFSPLWAGQNTSGCRPVPAAQLTRELAPA